MCEDLVSIARRRHHSARFGVAAQRLNRNMTVQPSHRRDRLARCCAGTLTLTLQEHGGPTASTEEGRKRRWRQRSRRFRGRQTRLAQGRPRPHIFRLATVRRPGVRSRHDTNTCCATMPLRSSGTETSFVCLNWAVPPVMRSLGRGCAYHGELRVASETRQRGERPVATEVLKVFLYRANLLRKRL